MKKVFKNYVWLFEFIGAAILIAFGITVIFTQEILLYVVGIIFLVLGIFRIIPLIKTTKDKLMKWIFIIEIIISITAGAALIYCAVKDPNGDKLGRYFGYIVGIVLYLRGFCHFLATSVRKEPTTFIVFIANMIFVTLGTICIALDGFDLNILAWIVLVLALLSAVFICFRGAGDYKKYRYELVIKSESKIKVKSDDIVEAPTSDEIIVNIPTDNKNIDKEEKKDEINA